MNSRYFPQQSITIINGNIVLALINDKWNWIKLGSSNLSILTTAQMVESSNAIAINANDN